MVKLTRAEAFVELGLPETAPDADIRIAYKKQARQWHPDKNPDPNATDKFQRVNAAYHRLTQGGDDDDYDSFAEEDIFDFFEMFFFRGRAPNFQRKGAKAHAGAKSRGGVFPPGTCPCGKPGCTGGMPPMFGNPFFFTGPGGPSGRGGWRPAPKGTTGRGRSNHEYYDDEDYDDDDDDSIYSDDLDEDERDFYDWYANDGAARKAAMAAERERVLAARAQKEEKMQAELERKREKKERMLRKAQELENLRRQTETAQANKQRRIEEEKRRQADAKEKKIQEEAEKAAKDAAAAKLLEEQRKEEEEARAKAETERLEWEKQLEAQRLQEEQEIERKREAEREKKEAEKQERLRKEKEKKEAEKKKKDEEKAAKKAEKEKKEREDRDRIERERLRKKREEEEEARAEAEREQKEARRQKEKEDFYAANLAASKAMDKTGSFPSRADLADAAAAKAKKQEMNKVEAQAVAEKAASAAAKLKREREIQQEAAAAAAEKQKLERAKWAKEEAKRNQEAKARHEHEEARRQVEAKRKQDAENSRRQREEANRHAAAAAIEAAAASTQGHMHRMNELRGGQNGLISQINSGIAVPMARPPHQMPAPSHESSLGSASRIQQAALVALQNNNRTLVEMGFSNTVENEQVLSQVGNDMSEAVDELMKRQAVREDSQAAELQQQRMLERQKQQFEQQRREDTRRAANAHGLQHQQLMKPQQQDDGYASISMSLNSILCDESEAADVTRFSGMGAHLPSSLWNDDGGDGLSHTQGSTHSGMTSSFAAPPQPHNPQQVLSQRLGEDRALHNTGLGSLFPWMQERGALSIEVDQYGPGNQADVNVGRSSHQESSLLQHQNQHSSFLPNSLLQDMDGEDGFLEGSGLPGTQFSSASRFSQGQGGSQCGSCGAIGMVLASDGGVCPSCWQAQRRQSRYLQPMAAAVTSSGTSSSPPTILPLSPMDDSTSLSAQETSPGGVMNTKSPSRLRTRDRGAEAGMASFFGESVSGDSGARNHGGNLEWSAGNDFFGDVMSSPGMLQPLEDAAPASGLRVCPPAKTADAFGVIACRYGAKCHSKACTFWHPPADSASGTQKYFPNSPPRKGPSAKMCKFGANCRSPSCKFMH